MNRKSILTGFLSLILLSILLATSCSAPSNAATSVDDWPMFQHDAAHTGTTASAGPTEPVELWHFPLGNDILSSATVVNGIVYVGGNANIYALNASGCHSPISCRSLL
jgi:PKD repeat protein